MRTLPICWLCLVTSNTIWRLSAMPLHGSEGATWWSNFPWSATSRHWGLMNSLSFSPVTHPPEWGSSSQLRTHRPGITWSNESRGTARESWSWRLQYLNQLGFHLPGILCCTSETSLDTHNSPDRLVTDWECPTKSLHLTHGPGWGCGVMRLGDWFQSMLTIKGIQIKKEHWLCTWMGVICKKWTVQL